MALQGFPALKIELDDDADALKDISAFVTEIGGYTVEQLLEELSSAGDATDRWAKVGFEQKSEITISGPYDDQADSLVTITKNGEGDTRTLKLTFDDPGTSDVRTVETLIRSTERAPTRGAFHKYSVVLRPTGAVT